MRSAPDRGRSAPGKRLGERGRPPGPTRRRAPRARAACRRRTRSRSGSSSGIWPSSGTPSSVGQRPAAALPNGCEHLAAAGADAGSSCSRSTPATRMPGLLGHLGRARGDPLRGRLRRRHDAAGRARAAAGRARSRRRRCPAACRRPGSRARPSGRRSGTARARGAASARARRRPGRASRKKPIDMISRPWLTGGTIMLSTTTGRRRDRRACAGSSSRRCRRRRRPTSAPPARQRGREVRRQRSTCRRRPCPTPRATTRVRGSSEIAFCSPPLLRRLQPLPQRRASPPRVITSKLTPTDSTPSTAPTWWRTCCSRSAFIGQPATVSAIVTSTGRRGTSTRPHHVELDDAAADLGIDDGDERLADRCSAIMAGV